MKTDPGSGFSHAPEDTEAFLAQSEQARKIFEDIQSLRSSLDTLRSGNPVSSSVSDPAAGKHAEGPKQPASEHVASGETSSGGTHPAKTADTADAVGASAAEQPAAEQMTSEEGTGTKASGAEGTGAKGTEAEQAEAKPAGVIPPVTVGTPPKATKNTSSFDEAYRQQMEQQMEAVQQKRKQMSKRDAARAEKARMKAEQKRLKAERDEARRQERKARAKQVQEERRLRAEVRRKKRLADKSAEMGGGVVNLHDTAVNTEIQPVPEYSLRDLLGIVPRKDRKAAETKEDLQALQQEREAIQGEALQAASHLSQVRANRFRKSAFGQKVGSFTAFCDKHKKLLLTSMSMILLVAVGMAGVFNYCTAYEYSYNGQMLGYVKNKDDVLRITDMVQKALTEEKDMEVIIDTRDDIEFQRVSILDRDVVPDSSEQVLRRLTYMGDLNVKAMGIYVNGVKQGAVKDKDTAAEVLKKLEDRYFSGKSGAVIEKAEIPETLEVRESNTDLRDVYSSDRMVDKLCTSGEKETVHTIVAGETLHSIAQEFGTTESRLQADNEGVDPRKLEPGSTLIIRQNAPILTVRLTERRTYDKKIKYKTQEKKTDEMYEDEEEVQQEGEDGLEELTERTVSVNGEVEKDGVTLLDRKVKKEVVDKIVLVGTAERPPSVGDGVYIWPLAGGYTLTSHFGHRWGRLHAGIDLGTPVGNDVLAADGGIVTRAGYFGGYGYCVDIDHQNGQQTRYGHLSSILVNVGDEVYEGQHIAESGNTGRSTGAHLHFEVHINGTPQNPLNFLP